MDRRKISTTHQGYIKLKDKVLVTDPNYSLGSFGTVTVNNVLPGKYAIYVRNAKEEDNYDGVSRVMLIHSDYIIPWFKGGYYQYNLIYDKNPSAILQCELVHRYHETPIGVDSGLAGFFNYDYIEKIEEKTQNNKMYPYHEKWYRWYNRICKIGNRKWARIDGNGFYTTNWFGDGGYNLYTFVDSADTEDEITVGFLLDYRLEEL